MSASSDEPIEVYPEGTVTGCVYDVNNPSSYHATDTDTGFSDEAYLFFEIQPVPDYLEEHEEQVNYE